MSYEAAESYFQIKVNAITWCCFPASSIGSLPSRFPHSPPHSSAPLCASGPCGNASSGLQLSEPQCFHLSFGHKCMYVPGSMTTRFIEIMHYDVCVFLITKQFSDTSWVSSSLLRLSSSREQPTGSGLSPTRPPGPFRCQLQGQVGT